MARGMARLGRIGCMPHLQQQQHGAAAKCTHIEEASGVLCSMNWGAELLVHCHAEELQFSVTLGSLL
jgi:hypothetical protein